MDFIDFSLVFHQISFSQFFRRKKTTTRTSARCTIKLPKRLDYPLFICFTLKLIGNSSLDNLNCILLIIDTIVFKFKFEKNYKIIKF